MATHATETMSPHIFERRKLAAPLSIQVVATAEPIYVAAPPNTPATAAFSDQAKVHDTTPARRFLVFKPREYLPAMNIHAGIFLQDDQPIMAAPPNSPIASRQVKFGSSEEEDEMELLPWAMEIMAGGDDEATAGASSDASDSSNPSRSLSPTSMCDFSEDEEIVSPDARPDSPENVMVDEIPASTRVIIRPLVRRASGFLGRLSRSSTPSSRPGTPSSLTRPSSPLGFNLGALNCFHNTDAFEKEVDYLQEQSAREFAGVSQVQVHVTRETTIQREELWREAVQQVLYGQRASSALRSSVSAASYGDYADDL